MLKTYLKELEFLLQIIVPNKADYDKAQTIINKALMEIEKKEVKAFKTEAQIVKETGRF